MELEKGITEEELAANKAATFVKRMAGRFANVKWPRLLVVKDKHENEYYLINDVDALWRWALGFLQKRVRDQYIREPEPPNLVEEVADDVIDKLPEAMKKKALSDKQSNKSLLKRHAKYVEIWNDVQKALADGNGALAFKVLDDRKDHEYEGFDFEDLEIP